MLSSFMLIYKLFTLTCLDKLECDLLLMLELYEVALGDSRSYRGVS